MSHLDPHKLLGGYATGTLTDAEKKILFTAALEDQDLFNALAEEEALREMLADPEARQELLAAIPAKQAAPMRSLWKRPAVLGLAASFFLLVTTSVVLWHRSDTPMALPALKHKVQENESPAEPPRAATSLEKSSQKARTVEAAPKAVPETTPAMAPPAPSADAVGAGLQAPEASPSQLPREEYAPAVRKDAAASAFPAEVADTRDKEFTARTVVHQKAEAKKAKQEESAWDYSKSIMAPSPANHEQTYAGAAPAPKSSAKLAGGIASLSPQLRLKRLKGEIAQLTVNWSSLGHLYVLKRTASTTALLTPLKSVPASGDTTITTFEFALGEKDAVDLYVMDQPVEDPAKLPATGPVQGFRKRVQPSAD